jgi:hypothetical protein
MTPGESMMSLFPAPGHDGQQVWYAVVPDRVHYEVRGDRYTLTLSHPSGVGAAVYGPVAGAISAGETPTPE